MGVKRLETLQKLRDELLSLGSNHPWLTIFWDPVGSGAGQVIQIDIGPCISHRPDSVDRAGSVALRLLLNECGKCLPDDNISDPVERFVLFMLNNAELLELNESEMSGAGPTHDLENAAEIAANAMKLLIQQGSDDKGGRKRTIVERTLTENQELEILDQWLVEKRSNDAKPPSERLTRKQFAKSVKLSEEQFVKIQNKHRKTPRT